MIMGSRKAVKLTLVTRRLLNLFYRSRKVSLVLDKLVTKTLHRLIYKSEPFLRTNSRVHGQVYSETSVMSLYHGKSGQIPRASAFHVAWVQKPFGKVLLAKVIAVGGAPILGSIF